MMQIPGELAPKNIIQNETPAGTTYPAGVDKFVTK
jgi:hypothetical protein